MAVRFIGGRNRRTRRKTPTCRKSLTDFITKCCTPHRYRDSNSQQIEEVVVNQTIIRSHHDSPLPFYEVDINICDLPKEKCFPDSSTDVFYRGGSCCSTHREVHLISSICYFRYTSLKSENMLSKRRPTFNSQHKKINKDNQKDMCQYLYRMIQIFMHLLFTKERTRGKRLLMFHIQLGLIL